jgi:hypothetical protein
MTDSTRCNVTGLVAPVKATGADVVVDVVITVDVVVVRDVVAEVVVRAGATQQRAAEDETGSRRERTVIIPAAYQVRGNAFLLDEHGEATDRVSFEEIWKN